MAVLIDLLLAIPGSASAHSGSDARTLDGQLRLWAGSQHRPATSPRAARAAILIWTRVHGHRQPRTHRHFRQPHRRGQRLIDVEVDNAIHAMTEA
jgi:hypothetical protein